MDREEQLKFFLKTITLVAAARLSEELPEDEKKRLLKVVEKELKRLPKSVKTELRHF
ncbi:hypothetical protein [Halothermothrix orenii]|uniref:hypothetical protein n=1 Tax=Halothermothrix orenii TaxID=31909 RepID=UPI0002F38C8B|nr:hypothetical protein [Halothermothrix orenii]